MPAEYSASVNCWPEVSEFLLLCCTVVSRKGKVPYISKVRSSSIGTLSFTVKVRFSGFEIDMFISEVEKMNSVKNNKHFFAIFEVKLNSYIFVIGLMKILAGNDTLYYNSLPIFNFIKLPRDLFLNFKAVLKNNIYIPFLFQNLFQERTSM